MDPWHFDIDPDPRIRTTDLRIRIRILLFSSVADKMPQKMYFFPKFFAYYLLFKGTGVHLLRFHRYKIKNMSQNSIKQGFSYFFCLLMEGKWFLCLQFYAYCISTAKSISTILFRRSFLVAKTI